MIFPVVQLIELCYLFAFRVFKDPGVSILGVSIAVSICTLPLYFFAEKYQQKERDLQSKLRPKIDKIKAVFRGDEQYMILSTYYKQNHYHPVYALRGTFGLLIQIPFFIAAYSYLSHLQALHGTSFFFIPDLGKPDALFSIGSGYINVLPLLMTLVNIVSGVVYTKGLGVKDKVQLYGMALVFLVLLYNSPSGLVLYWTMNNIFSLVKNILQRTKNQKIIIYAALCVCAGLFDVFVIFFHHGYWLKRTIFCIAVSCVFFFPFFIKITRKFRQKIGSSPALKDTLFWQDRVFILSILVLFLLAGFVIPSSLIASSVFEFLFIEPYSSPLPFIFHTALQAAGMFLLWPLCLYYLFSKKIKIGMTIFVMALGVVVLINTFLVQENFGFLTNTLIFSEPKPIFAHINTIILNIAGIVLALVILSFLLFSKWKRVIFSFNVIAVISLAGFGILNTGIIAKEYFQLQKQQKLEADSSEHITPVYTFSRTGKNVLLIMLDRGISGYLPIIFEEKPELLSVFSGFTWYPNCASFASHTLAGAPPLYGGYEYTPRAINNRNTVTMLEKHKEAYLLLPLLFSNAGYSVTVTDPPFDNYRMSNMSIYIEYPQIHAENIHRLYSTYWNQRHPNVIGLQISDLLKNTLLRFSFFKMSPLAFRYFIYDAGEWLATTNMNTQATTRGKLTRETIDDYAFLDLLPQLTKFEEVQTNIFTMLYSLLPHSYAFLQAPDYIPVQTVTDRGNGPFAEEPDYHANIASFLLLGKWFSFLKERGVYHNTRIIIVSDHGSGGAWGNSPHNISLPNAGKVSGFNPILMVKDFNADGVLATDDSFMTNADTPLLTLENIIDNPVNPFTHAPLKSDKEQGINIATIGALSSHDHTKYEYRIGKNQWLFVKDNIFDPANWKAPE